MRSSHVVGGSSAAFVGAIAVSLVNRFFHSHISDAEAFVIGGAALSAGVGIGHAIATLGVFGAIKRFFKGPENVPVVYAQVDPASAAQPAPAPDPSAPAGVLPGA